jgi:hypothetical protein
VAFHLLAQENIVVVTRHDDLLRGLGTLNAKDLLEAAQLSLVTGLLKLVLALRLGLGLHLEHPHQLHVKLVTLLADGRLRFRPLLLRPNVCTSAAYSALHNFVATRLGMVRVPERSVSTRRCGLLNNSPAVALSRLAENVFRLARASRRSHHHLSLDYLLAVLVQ